MRESPNHNFAVLSYLEKAGKPVTATEVHQETKLPLSLVTRILMARVNASYRDVEITEIDDMVTFRYTGEVVLPPPVKEKKAAFKKAKDPIVSAKTQPKKKVQPTAKSPAQPAVKILQKKSIKEPAKKQISVTKKNPTSTGKSRSTFKEKINNKASVPDPMKELASALDKANWLNEEFKKNVLGLVGALKHK
jgi:hypothetical protein